MLHAVDSDAASERREWIGLLAKSDLALLESGMRQVEQPGYAWLRRPETGLMMVRGRVGGTGDRFNLGEITVTRCALRIGGGQSGIAYVQGRSHRKAELAAMADAMLQAPEFRDAVKCAVLEPARRAFETQAGSMLRRAQATRVEFFTVAREAGA